MRIVYAMKAILEKAIAAYRRRLFLIEVNKAYAALRQDPKAWAQVERERMEWETTLGDGLEPIRPSTVLDDNKIVPR